jgi:hypothetical protein
MNHGCVLLCCAVLAASGISAEQLKVRYKEGVSRGFLVLRTEDGRKLADGETLQTATDDTVTSQLIFHFKDGSVYEDSTTFTQRGTFGLQKDHVVQKGPAFQMQLESTIDTAAHRVTVRYTKPGQKEKSLDQDMAFPLDLANGLIFTLVKNIGPEASATVSYLAITPKPRLVKLVFSRIGRERLFADTTAYQAFRYDMKVEIGGLTGVVASVMKKVPPDIHLWIVDGQVPAFAASEGPLYGEGPVWKISLVSPKVAADNQ